MAIIEDLSVIDEMEEDRELGGKKKKTEDWLFRLFENVLDFFFFFAFPCFFLGFLSFSFSFFIF